MTEKDHTKIQFRLRDMSTVQIRFADRHQRLAGTGESQSAFARLELETLYQVIRLELGKLPAFTLPELRYTAMALEGPACAAGVTEPLGLTYMRVHDAQRRGGVRHGTEQLQEKLAALGPAADHALRDAISRWYTDRARDTADGFTRYGLRVVSPEKVAR